MDNATGKKIYLPAYYGCTCLTPIENLAIWNIVEAGLIQSPDHVKGIFHGIRGFDTRI